MHIGVALKACDPLALGSTTMTDGSALLARVEDEASFAQLLSEVRDHGGLVVEVPREASPSQFSTVVVWIVAPAGEQVRVLAQVKAQLLQILAPGQAAVMLSDDERATLLNTTYEGGGSAVSHDDDGGDGDGDDGEEEPLPDHDDGGAAPRDLPLWAKWEELSKPDRIKLARYGNADARRMVLKDRDPSLHRMVLNNPGLTPNELVALLKGGAASSTLVRAITERNELVGNISVADALVHSPHTPLDIAIRLVAKIPLDSAKRIAKAGNLRAGVVGAARKRVLR